MTDKKDNWTSRLWSWAKKYWWALLVVPLIFVAFYRAGDGISWVFKKIRFFDENEDEHKNDVEEIDREEDRKIEDIDKKVDAVKDGIDDGDPTPAEVFDKEINRER